MTPGRFLVTGGSQGIDAAIVVLARKAGHEVLFTGRNEQLIRKVAQETGKHGLRADVSVSADNARTVETCRERVQTDFGGNVGRNNPNKLSAEDIGATIMAALDMQD